MSTLDLAALLPEGRVLTEEELADLAGALPRLLELRGRLQATEGQRAYEPLLRTEHAEVWLIAWRDDADTGFHDHDGASGAVHVLEGHLVEQLLAPGLPGGTLDRHAPAGTTFTFDGMHVHRVRHVGGPHALSVHAYSPPLVRMGSYELGPDGALRRRSVPGDDELRAPTLALAG